MKIKLNYLLYVSAFMLFLGCKNENSLENEIVKLEVDFNVERFDKLLSQADSTNLQKLKEIFPFLFPKEIDSVWLNRFNGELQKQVFFEVNEKFENFNTQKLELKNLFNHLKYYDSNFQTPRVITVADYVDYRNKLVLEADLLIINFSNYLGVNHEFYQNIPIYFAENMKPSQIIPEIADKYATRYNYQTQRRTFLDEIIYHGKQLYFKDVMIPEFSDADKIGYSESDIKWSIENESQIWSYFVEKEILFSTNPKLLSRFTVPAPFSKFYLELDNESPGRLGQYMGWQIVRAYAERTGDDIMKIMSTDSNEIFEKSKYKPKR